MKRLQCSAVLWGLAVFGLVLCAAPALAGVVEGYYVKSVKDLGEKLTLTDGSEWVINQPSDRDLVYEWLPGQSVAIRDGKVLINTVRGDQVDGEQVKGPAPKAPTQPAASGSGGSGGPYRTVSQAPPPPDLKEELIRIHQRLDSLDNKIRVMDWRLRQMEHQLTVVPPVKQ